MKTKILLLASAVCMALGLQAQAPQMFNYQGIARTSEGAPIASQTLGLKISILDGNTTQYMEKHTVSTNAFGLYTVRIGGGTVLSGSMAAVTWSTGNKKIRVAIDANGGSIYTDIGVSELLSVPYALYAGEVSTSGWGLNGNVVADSDYIGTKNKKRLKFKVYGKNAGHLDWANNTTAFGLGSLDKDNSSNFGYRNAAFGSYSQYLTTEGIGNTSVGAYSLSGNTTGGANVGIGDNALITNITGSYNMAVGSFADVGSSALTNANAIGSYAYATQSNSMVLGSIEGVNYAPASTKVGIGTTAPSAPLEIKANSYTNVPQLRLRENTTGYSRIHFQNSNTGAWVLAGVKGGTDANSLFNVFYSANADGNGGSDILSVSGQGKAGVNTSVASISNSVGALSVRSQGLSTDNVSLLNSSSTYKWGLWVNETGGLNLYYNTGYRGYFNNVSGAYYSTSDRSLKENITPVSDVLARIKGVEVMRYTFKSDAGHVPQLGYIAQNLEEHFPEFVGKPEKTMDKESYYTVNYAGMSAVAIKAIQEQQAIIEALQQALAKVQARLDRLEK